MNPEAPDLLIRGGSVIDGTDAAASTRASAGDGPADELWTWQIALAGEAPAWRQGRDPDVRKGCRGERA